MPPARKAETICTGPSIVPFTVRSLRSQTGHDHLPLPYLLAHLGRMHADVTYLAALIAGLVSFLSPCVLPLVPPYLVFLAGTSLERFADREPEPRVKLETVSAAVLFVLGFSTVFVALGASASVIGSLIRAYSGPLATVAGIIIIIMGLHFLGVTPDSLFDLAPGLFYNLKLFGLLLNRA